MGALLQKLWRFNGGVHLDEHKSESLQTPIDRLPVPNFLQVQMRQHIGVANEPVVQVGERVRKGQVLALAQGAISAPVHAPTSGVITRIESMPIPHVSGVPARCIEIESDGLDEWGERIEHHDFRALSPQEVCTVLHESGVVGLGGALFPTAVKLAAQHSALDTLVINGAECEPYISCDQALMAERAADIVSGIEIAAYALQTQRVLIGVEDNKPDSIAALRAALKDVDLDIQLAAVPTLYPTGGERQLVKVMTSKEVPAGGLPADIGVRVINVATAFAVYRAVRFGEPLISRIVTVSGDAVAHPGNLEVLIGTPINVLIEHCGGYTSDVSQLTMGGPMMGFALPSDELPVIKSTNCLIASSVKSVEKLRQLPCIRCGECARACPANLLPQQLYWYAKARDLPKVQEYNLADCIECGACAYVCPSHIPLVQYYRYAKSEIADETRNREQADAARLRFEAREARLEAIKRDKEARMAKKRAALEASKKSKKQTPTVSSSDAEQAVPADKDSKQDVIAAALARVQAKKVAKAERPKNTEQLTAVQQQQIAEADSRRAQNDPLTQNQQGDSDPEGIDRAV